MKLLELGREGVVEKDAKEISIAARVVKCRG